MLEIRQSLIDDQIPQIKFACDIASCKGACCTLSGGTGAPLLDEELPYLTASYPEIRSLLPEEHIQVIEQHGLYEGTAGGYTTSCYNNRACVFVLYTNGIARCAFEKRFNEGKLHWRKPISCHLFPIRVNYGLVKHLRYEYIGECNPALSHGEKEDIYLSDFLKDSLIRAFGLSWYSDFQAACIHHRTHRKLQESGEKVS